MSENKRVSFGGAVKPQAFRENLVARTIANKLVADPNRGFYTRKYSGGTEAPTIGALGNISQSISDKILDAENILETLPDTELAMRIVVSSIISPSDLRMPELSFKSEEAKLDPGLLAELTRIVEEHFTKDYKIKDWMEKALEDALFRTGSHVLAVVPENNLDDIINNRNPIGMEQFNAIVNGQLDANKVPKCIGNLGMPSGAGVSDGAILQALQKPSFENLFGAPTPPVSYNSKIHTGLYVTDNPAALSLGIIADRAIGAGVRKRVASASKIRVAYENLQTVSELITRIHQRPTNRMTEVVRIQGREKGSRAPIGHPLVMKLPSESVIPVHIPSNPESHLGYFVLLDDLGHPINNTSESTHYADLQNRLKTGQNMGEQHSRILNNLSFLNSGFSCQTDMTAAALSQSYAEAVERDLLERLKSGAYGENVELAKVNEVYRIMLSRVLAGKRTMILYIPSELVTYIAFHYNKMGIGRSLLDKNKMLASLRATLMFANVMAALKNSVARQKVNIQLDEADVDPQKTVDLILTDLAKLRARATPFGSTAPLDIVDGIQQAAISVAVSGNPNYPEVEVGVEDVQSARVQPDTELAERLDNQWWMSLGLAPEIVDSLQQVEFAAVQMTSNALMTKRFAMDQLTFCGFLSDHVRKYVGNSGTLLSKMILAIRTFRDQSDQTELESEDVMNGQAEAIAEPEGAEDDLSFNEQGMAVAEADDAAIVGDSPYTDLNSAGDLEIVEEFLSALTIALPPPDTTRIQAQAEEFSNYSSFLDEAIPAYVNQDVIGKIAGPQASEHVGEIIAVVKAHYQRDFLIRNNILPELQDLMATESEGSGGVVENYVSFQESIGKVLGKLIGDIAERNNAGDESSGGYDNTDADMTNSDDSELGSDDDAPPEGDLSALDDTDTTMTDSPSDEDLPEENVDDADAEPAPDESADTPKGP
jgi:hypothetical protein